MKITEITKTLNPPSISVGDEVKVGKFKNRKAEVKGFKKDDHGQPVLKTTKGDQKLYKPRVSKLEPKKITEITKGEFKGKLQYEWMEELIEGIHRFKNGWAAEHQWGVEFHTDKDPMILRLYRFGGSTTSKTARITIHQLLLNTIITKYFNELNIHEHETIPRSQSKYPEMSWTVTPTTKEDNEAALKAAKQKA